MDRQICFKSRSSGEVPLAYPPRKFCVVGSTQLILASWPSAKENWQKLPWRLEGTLRQVNLSPLDPP